MSEQVRLFNTVEGIAEGEITEKKSRFIATVIHVESEEEAISHIDRLKKQYWDARHNCHAFIIGKGSELMRFSDDGEPQGTAGKPILEVLKAKELTNTLVVVTRYFGGVLLGTGGLVRAYTDSTLEGIKNSSLKRMLLVRRVGITVDYNTIGKLKYMLASNEIIIVEEQYTDMVKIIVAIPIDDMKKTQDKITDVTGGRAVFEVEECDYIATDY